MRRHAELLTIVAVLIGSSAGAAAQEAPQHDGAQDSSHETFSIGGYAGYVLTTITGAFAVDTTGAITPSGECGRFETGSGNGFVAGAVVERPVSQTFRLSFRPEFEVMSGTMRFPCVDPAMIRLPGGGVVAALTDHVVEISRTRLSAILAADFQPAPFPLQLSAGAALSLPLSETFSAHEDIVQPASAEFVTGGQVRQYGNGTFTDAGVSFGLYGAVRYRARIGERAMLLPEVSYLLGLTDEVSSAGIRTSSLRVTLGIVYRFESQEEPPPPPVVETPTAVPPPPVADLSLKAVAPDGSRGDTLHLRISRTITSELHPLLNFLFFDSGSSLLPGRYIRRTTDQVALFSEASLKGEGNLDIYHNLLDIIGARLTRYPTATITLTGTQPDQVAPGDLSLAARRAEAVRSYLADVWKIPASRITVASRQNPLMQSNPDVTEGADENRRVEITSSRYEIIEPVLLADTSERAIVEPVEIAQSVREASGSRDWNLEIADNGGRLAQFNGAGTPPPSILWRGDSLFATLGRIPQQLEGHLAVHDSTGGEGQVTATIPVRRLVNADSITYGSGFYSLIIFDFGSASLSSAHQRTIDLINSRTSTSTTARIYGYTDKLGEEEVNRQLSSNRAESVARHIKARVVEVAGKGVNTTLYDNSLPEGRFYSRSVTIQTE